MNENTNIDINENETTKTSTATVTTPLVGISVKTETVLFHNYVFDIVFLAVFFRVGTFPDEDSRTAISECVRAYVGDTFRNDQLLERSTAIEGIASDFGHGRWNIEVLQRAATHKCHIANSRNTVF